MTPADLDALARDLGELRVEVDRVLGRVLSALHAARRESEQIEQARADRDDTHTRRSDR